MNLLRLIGLVTSGFVLLVGAVMLMGSLLPDGGQVVFSSTRSGGDADLFRLDVRRALPVNLTAQSDGHETSPVWSPDGGRIAFEYARAGTSAVSQIAVIGANGRGRLVVYEGTGEQPAWSPDGRWIAFYTADRLLTVGSDGRDAQIDTQDALRLSDWQPDGSLWTTRTLMQRLVLGEAETEDSEQRMFGSILDANWSPGGRYITFTFWTGSGTRTRLLDAGCMPACVGRSVRVPGTENGRAAAPDADGRRVIYECRDGGAAGLCLVDLVSSESYQIVRSASGVRDKAPRWR